MALRLPLPLRRLGSLPIRSLPVGVRSGPNAGRSWSLAASGRGIWRGYYEQDRFDTLAELVGEGDVFWDIGAHRGYAGEPPTRRWIRHRTCPHRIRPRRLDPGTVRRVRSFRDGSELT